MAELGVETWVPEPVAWEWAQHLAEDWDAVRMRLGEANKQLQKAALTTFEVRYADAAAVAEDFLCQLVSVPHVVVVPLAGLRDQVLRTRSPSQLHDPNGAVCVGAFGRVRTLARAATASRSCSISEFWAVSREIASVLNLAASVSFWS